MVPEAAQLVGRKAQRVHDGDNRAMRAAVMQAFEQPLTIEDVPDPVCEPDGVVVEVRATGVCRSDWHGWMGHDPSIALPHVPGHELCGVVAEVGAGGARLRGRRPRHGAVLLRVRDVRAVPARRDADLRARLPAGVHRLGLVRASCVALPRADLNLVRVPEALSDVEAASLGCRFMTAWAALHVHAGVRAGEWVAVHGCGGVGLAAVMIAAAAGASVIAVDIDERKLVAGARAGRGARDRPTWTAIRELTGGGAHVSVDALGSAVTCVNSVGACASAAGTCRSGCCSRDERSVAMPMARVIAHELRVFGVHGMAVRHYDGMLRAIASGAVRPGELVAKTIGLDEAGDELASMGRFAQEGVTVVVP